jgi:hypothetical protein
MPRLRFSTSTLAGGEIVPWLASCGELAYSPHSPPERDYYFQYSWVIPAIFRPGVNLRRHFWFGGPLKDSREVRLLFRFWNNARRGKVEILYLSNGMAGVDEVRAPLAVYRHSEASPLKRERLILIQHGSYLITEVESQPYLDRREAVLYRGVQAAEEFFPPQADKCEHPFTVDERSRRHPGRFSRVVQCCALQCIEDGNRMLQ